MMIDDNSLMHIGTKYHSGRYKYGSGENPFQHDDDFITYVRQKRQDPNYKFVDKKTNKTYYGESAIARSMGLTTAQFRIQWREAQIEQKNDMFKRAKEMRKDGLTNAEIATKLGLKGESSVRNLLTYKEKKKKDAAVNTASFLEERLKSSSNGLLDVGKGVDRQLNISKEKLQEALYMLERKGYPLYKIYVPQATNPNQHITMLILGNKKTEKKDAYEYDKIDSVNDYTSRDNGKTFEPSFRYPASMNSKRLSINYAEDGGTSKDGLIEIRRGVKDLDLDGSNYAQVRILVDGTHYIKGMAVYSDDIPKGKDIVFNTNKKRGTDVKKVLKKIDTADPNNPFGSLIKEHGGQHYYDDPNGKYTDPVTGKKQSLSLINKRSDEGDWSKWSKSLPAQFLSKQNITLAKQQLQQSITEQRSEFDKIKSTTNPVIKKHLLEKFASDCDSKATRLNAAALPRQRYQVILPLTNIKDSECYAPRFKQGEQIALIRFPHAGTYEIPILTVNNKNSEGRKKITNRAKDAIGLNANNASILSGADFDGDSVLAIPISNISKISNRPPLKGLVNFDPKTEYGTEEKINKKTGEIEYWNNGKKVSIMKPKTQTKGIEMGRASNLINDMTLKGATDSELTKAVKHSMVVIDAEKHHLDYRLSEKENDIKRLRDKYMGHYTEDGDYSTSASTLISRANADMTVLKSKGQPKINKETGEIEYNRVKETYVDPKTGKTKYRTQNMKQMMSVSNAYDLVSPFRTKMELVYADYANKQKNLANEARKMMITTKGLQYNPSARKVYENEYRSLFDKLIKAETNAPNERQAQRLANIKINRLKKAAESYGERLGNDDLKKIRQRAIVESRTIVGANRNPIEITPNEWKCIQSGGVTNGMLEKILKYTDMDLLFEYAMPSNNRKLKTYQISSIKNMSNNGYTISEIATRLSISPSTVEKYI